VLEEAPKRGETCPCGRFHGGPERVNNMLMDVAVGERIAQWSISTPSNPGPACITDIEP